MSFIVKCSGHRLAQSRTKEALGVGVTSPVFGVQPQKENTERYLPLINKTDEPQTHAPFPTASLEKEDDGMGCSDSQVCLPVTTIIRTQHHAPTAFPKPYIATKYGMIKVYLGIGRGAQLVKLLSRHESWVLS